MGTVVLKRRWQWSGFYWSYDVFLDGDRVGAVRRGQELSLDVTPGERTLQVRKTNPFGDELFSEKLTFKIGESEKVLFKCRTRTRWKGALRYFFGKDSIRRLRLWPRRPKLESIEELRLCRVTHDTPNR